MREQTAVIAGTTESRTVIEQLLGQGEKVLACVATELGAKMLEEFKRLFVEQKVHKVVDVSHPFAKVVTQTVTEACKELSLPYERIKREQQTYNYEKIIWVADAKEAARQAAKQGGVVLLTTGANTAAVYAKLLPNMEETLYIRVLDTESSIQICEAAKIPREHIIAKMPPYSMQDNLELIEKINAAVLVSKDSGKQGGVEAKVEACKAKNIPMILIHRPENNLEVSS